MAQQPILSSAAASGDAGILGLLSLDPDSWIYHRAESIFHLSPFAATDDMGHFRLRHTHNYLPTLNKTDSLGAKIESSHMEQSFAVRAAPGTIVLLSRSQSRRNDSFEQVGTYSARWNASHATPGAGITTRLFSDSSERYWDVATLVPDLEKPSIQVVTRYGRTKAFHLEWDYAYREKEAEFFFDAVDENGIWNRLEGEYNGNTHVSRILLRKYIQSIPVAVKAAFGWSSPTNPRGEYGLADSSRLLNLGLKYGGDGQLESPQVWIDFLESDVHTQGLRVHPESQGVKRFHYAYSHAYQIDGGWRSAAWKWAGGAQSRVEATARYARFQSDPHPDGFAERKESLSYNRLGLSFIADIYGGFYQSAEFVTAYFRIPTLGIAMKHAFRRDPFTLWLDLPVFLSKIDLEWKKETMTQTIFVVNTEQSHSFRLAGETLVATPRLGLAFRHGGLLLSGRLAQTLLLWDSLATLGQDQPESIDGETGEIGQTGETGERSGKYPLGSNGLSVEFSASFDF